jgi:hypothetical protein
VARIVSRRPLIGLIAGFIFGTLGFLLIGMDGAPAGVSRLSSLLFPLSGYFFLFVAAMAWLAATMSFLRAARRR